MDQVRLEAKERAAAGSGASRKWRQQGMVPGIVYGGDGSNISVAVDSKALHKVLSTEHGVNIIIDLAVEGKGGELVMVREIQYDIVSHAVHHVDFRRVDLSKKVRTMVPLHLSGEGLSIGIKSGGVLQHDVWEIEVECLPNAIPDNIELDISTLDIGDTVHVGDLKAPENVKILDEAAKTVIHIAPPQKAEAEEAAAAAPAEPELVGDKKAEKAETK